MKIYTKLESQFDTEPFMYACYFGNLRMVKMFVEYYKVDLDRVDKLQRNGFMLACGERNIDIIKYLLLKSVNVNQKDINGQTGFQYLDWE